MESSEIQRSDQTRHVGRLKDFFSLGPRRIGRLFKDTFLEWTSADVFRLGAALAYYTIFSLAPLLIVVMWVAGAAFGEAAVRGQIAWQIEYLIGTKGAEGVQTMLQAAAQPGQGLVAAILGPISLCFGASLVVSELRNSLNIIWRVPATGTSGVLSSLMDLLHQRLFAFVLVLGIGFLMLVSLLVNTAIAAAGKYFQYWLPASESVLQ